MQEIYNTTDSLYLDKDVVSIIEATRAAPTDSTPQDILCGWRSENRKKENRPTFQDILSAVCRVTGVGEDVVLTKGRREPLPKAKSLIVWFSWTYTSMDTGSIQNNMGYSNHSSINHAKKTINDEMPVYEDTRYWVSCVKKELLSNGFTLKIQPRINNYAVEQKHITV